MGDEVRVTVIATGFERTGMPRRVMEMPKNQPRQDVRPVKMGDPLRELQPVDAVKQIEFTSRKFNTDDIDLPTFLRNRQHG